MENNEKLTNTLMPGEYFKVANGIWGMKIVFVNVYMIKSGQRDWVLVDAGLKYSGNRIRKMAASLFGYNKPPKAIILTHGHFDHVGALEDLLQTWDVPVYAHYLELPYLTGKSAYPPPDPTVGGGLMSLSSFLFPASPIDISDKVIALDEHTDNHVPFLPGWRFVPTPGHAPGHISLFMEKHHVLIAGDAFVTTKQESAIAVASQKRMVSGPPKYFTYDWDAANASVNKLILLEPKVAATGHGRPMQGERLTKQLQHLAEAFDEIAVPASGRYVNKPARADKRGVQFVPKRPFPVKAAAAILTLAAAAAVYVVKKNKSSKLFGRW